MAREYKFTVKEAQKKWGTCKKSSQVVADLFQKKYNYLAYNCFDGLAGYLLSTWNMAKPLRKIKEDDGSCDVDIPEEIILESEGKKTGGCRHCAGGSVGGD